MLFYQETPFTFLFYVICPKNIRVPVDFEQALSLLPSVDQPDILPVLNAVERDLFSIGISLCTSFLMSLAQCCHTQHATTGSHYSTLLHFTAVFTGSTLAALRHFCKLRPCMEYDDIRLHIPKPGDQLALFIASVLATAAPQLVSNRQ